jgi:hypothetical protein
VDEEIDTQRLRRGLQHNYEVPCLPVSQRARRNEQARQQNCQRHQVGHYPRMKKFAPMSLSIAHLTSHPARGPGVTVRRIAANERRIAALHGTADRGKGIASLEEAAMTMLDDYLVDPRLSLIDKTRIRAQVLVPVIQALRSELGKAKADAIIDGSPRRKWAAMHTAMAEITEQDVKLEMLRHDKESLEFDITHCRFADFFRALGESELGALLICETDFDIAAAGGSEVSLSRDQTIMRGAPSCTFRYKFASR